MTDMPGAAGSGRAPGGAGPKLIRRHDLVAALDRAAQKRVTIISAPAGSGKTSLLRTWADQPGRDCRIAFVTVRPGQHDMQLFWLAMLGAVRAAAGTGEGGAQLPPVVPGSSGSAMADKVLCELEESGDRYVLVIDDAHELSSAEAAGQLTELLTRLPPDVRAVVATRRDLPLRLHKLRLAGDLAEIRAARLRFTERETRQLLAAAGIALPEHVAAMLHQRTEGWAAGLRLAVLALAGHSDPERFVAEFSGSATREDVAMHQQYIADIEASSREALASVNPGPIFKHYGENAWAAVSAYLDAVTEHAAAPVIAKYTGVLGGADIEIFTRTTTFAIMQSIRLDRGPSGPVHP